MKRLVSVLALIFLLSVPAFGLSDSEYLRMRKSNADFARADRNLNQVWSRLRKSLPKNVFTRLDRLQREWVKSGRDEEAASLMEDGYSRIEAYTMVTNDRADSLPKIADDIRRDLRRGRNNEPRTPQSKNTTPKRNPKPAPKPEPEEPEEPESPIDERPVGIEGEYKNANGFVTVKIIDPSTNEAEVTFSRFRDEVHWTAKGWIDDNVLELSDNNYSECQATLRFSGGTLKVEITETDDWNEAVGPDFVVEGTYRKFLN